MGTGSSPRQGHEVNGGTVKNEFAGIQVTPRPGEDFERTIKRFTRKVRAERVIEEYRERMYYRKPSEKRRQKASKARYAIKNSIES